MSRVWDAFDTATRAEPDKELLVLPYARYTYREVYDRALNLSRSLLRLGIRPGDVIAVWLMNGSEWITTFFAAARIGAPVAGINTRLRAAEVQHLLDDTRAAVLVLGERPAGVDFVALAYYHPEHWAERAWIGGGWRLLR